ncbi:T9SS type A sorting domain-containing protein [candidate division WOR-3 bacterium]|nr:T9SS type A sorting domain-containing protein [candidate division WOR-3 bacterium]
MHYIDRVGKLRDIKSGYSSNEAKATRCHIAFAGYAVDWFGDVVTNDEIWTNEHGMWWRGFARFNTAAIPDASIVVNVTLSLFCINHWWRGDHDIWSIETKPTPSSCGNALYSDAGSGYRYVDNYRPTLGAWNSWVLGDNTSAYACAQMTNLLPADWFAIGMSDHHNAWHSFSIGYDKDAGWVDVNAQPLAVEMGWFRATGEYEEVLLEWETYHEFDNKEWKIVRATEREGEYKERKTLDAEGRPNIYEWTDSDVKPGTTYFYKLGDVDRSGNVTWHGPEMATAKLSELIPFGISQNYPNPVSNSTTIEYYVPGKVDKQSSYVTLQIFDITGSLVRTLVSGEKISGRHEIEWHREDERGRRVGAGIYLYRLSVGDDVETRKMVVVR